MSEAIAPFRLNEAPDLDLLILSVKRKRRKAGRKRIHLSNAAKQRAYRGKSALMAKSTPRLKMRPPATADPYDWNRYLASVGLSVSRGLFMAQAPKGKGLLVTGGYDSKKVSAVDAAHVSVEGLDSDFEYHPR